MKFKLGLCPARWERPNITELERFMHDPLVVDAYLLPEAYIAEEKLEDIKILARNNGKWIFSGMKGSDGNQYAIAIDNNGEEIHRHLKLVLSSYEFDGGSVQRGKEVSAFDTPWGKMGFLLCYEIRFPEIARRMKEKGVKIFLNPIGDGGDDKDGVELWAEIGRIRGLDNTCYIAGVSHSHTPNFIVYAANTKGDFIYNSDQRVDMTRATFDMDLFPTREDDKYIQTEIEYINREVS